MQIVQRRRTRVSPGSVHGQLTILGEPFLVRFTSRPAVFVVCECSCGKVKAIRVSDIATGRTRSCGCVKDALVSARQRTHGGSASRLYEIWTGIHRRCRNGNCSCYKSYGEAGIAVCDEWATFEPFRDWAMSNGYTDELTLDRRKNDQNYSPVNCRWTTRLRQAQNRRKTSQWPFKGIRFRNGRWDARITHNGVAKFLGRFTSPEDAGRAYDAAAIEMFGEFACLNFPKQ